MAGAGVQSATVPPTGGDDQIAAGGEVDDASLATAAGGTAQEAISEKSGASPAPARPQKTGTSSRPVQVAGEYPMRKVTYYQFSTSDIRSIGLAQAAAAVFAALGTFALSSYLDFSKDITLAEEAGQGAPEFLQTVADLSFWVWIVFWVIAALAFFWQGNELSRIKVEHGELTLWRKARNRWTKRGTR